MARRLANAFALALMLALATLPAFAVQPDEVLPDAGLEARARDLGRELRCLVCQNQSIDDSNAAIARDLRLLIRERLVDGDTDGEVIEFVVARYGEFVLLRPRLNAGTAALWLAPVLFLIGGALAVLFAARRRRSAAVDGAPLSEQEKAELDALLRRDGR